METHIVGEREGESNICHNGDHHVLLEIEFSGVKTPHVTKGSELPGREDRFQEFAGRESKKLSDVGRDRDAGLTDAEELVDKTSVELSISACARRVASFRRRPEK